ncbi:DNA polymerase III subunit epsilon-like [Saccostrea cucullata]|uniref:DNA polymerase III subunit epsilon-like n=1 Tax=Saccostrea cuccullata TaxID=36930 RepID=UPI002ED36AEF
MKDTVNEAAALSPGRHTLKVCDRIDKLRRERRDKVSTIKAKRRRLQLKRVRNKKEKVSTIKEGTTYSTNIALSQQVVEEQIPSPLTYNKEENYVVIDLETTGLGHNSDITQIAAVGSDGSKFSCYVTPRCNISKEASRVTGLTFSKLRNKLFLHGLEVPSKLPNVALLDFIEYLTSMNNPILVGHNITNFDIPVLTNRLIEFHLFSTFCKTVYGFIDTLKVSRRVFPKSEVQNHKQETLVEKILQFKYDAHNAVEDVHFLQLLFDGKLKHLKLANRRDPNGIRIILKENKISLKAIKALHVYINESEE